MSKSLNKKANNDMEDLYLLFVLVLILGIAIYFIFFGLQLGVQNLTRGL